jgi:hypothetical protein
VLASALRQRTDLVVARVPLRLDQLDEPDEPDEPGTGEPGTEVVRARAESEPES